MSTNTSSLHASEPGGTIPLFTHLTNAPQPREEGQPVLIIERSPAIREMLAHVLSRAGYASHRLADVTELSSYVNDPPRFLLFDVSSPSAAIEVQRLHAQWRAMSAHPLPALILLTTQIHVRRSLEPYGPVLIKPFHIHELLAAIQARLGEQNAFPHSEPKAGDQWFIQVHGKPYSSPCHRILLESESKALAPGRMAGLAEADGRMMR